MHESSLPSFNNIYHYDKLLQRYARFFLKDEDMAAKVVSVALQHYFDSIKAINAPTVRAGLQQYTLVLCRFWLHYQSTQEIHPDKL